MSRVCNGTRRGRGRPSGAAHAGRSRPVTRFLLDESADLPLRGHLRARGHDVTAIAHEYPSALDDDDVLGIAVREDRVLITNDRDFGELVFRRGLPHRGIILFRLGDESLPVKTAWLDHVLDAYATRLP